MRRYRLSVPLETDVLGLNLDNQDKPGNIQVSMLFLIINFCN